MGTTTEHAHTGYAQLVHITDLAVRGVVTARRRSTKTLIVVRIDAAVVTLQERFRAAGLARAVDTNLARLADLAVARVIFTGLCAAILSIRERIDAGVVAHHFADRAGGNTLSRLTAITT